MAFKFSKEQQKSIQKAIKVVGEKRDELDGAVQAFNDKMEELFSEIEAKDEAFTEAAAGLRSVVERIVDGWRAEWDYKSARWQESENGEAASMFIEGWESFAQELPEVSLEKPEPLEVGELPDLEGMPMEAVES